MSSTELQDPELTSAEKHLLSRIVHEGAAASLMFEAAYLVPAIVLVLIGLWHSSNAAFVSAFTVVLTFRVWAIRYERESGPVLKSAISKVCAKARVFGPGAAG
jgi:hypothetical protein